MIIESIALEVTDMIEKGMKAPGISLCDQNGELRSLSEFKGRKVVLYFYPKDMTSGCARHAAGFAELYQRFLERGAVVIGVSRDSVATHKRFEEKYSLPFILLSDPERTATEAYGVWQEKKNYGKTSMGVVRSSFIIDENGVVEGAFYNVKAADNPAEMLERLEG